jgi:aspartate aminotransferase
MLAGGKPVVVESEGERFNPTAVEFEKCIGQNTKLIVLNSPCNPTGEIYSEHQLRDIAKLAKERGLWILFDESYRNLIRPGCAFIHPAAAFPGIRDQVVTVGSFSKSLAITGWRVGYAYGGQEVIRRLKKLQSHTASNANSLAQYAISDITQNEVVRFNTKVNAELDERCHKIQNSLKGQDLISYSEPCGAFYFFLDFRKIVGKRMYGIEVDSTDRLAEILIEHAHVALTPGSAFGKEGFMRLSYAIDRESIQIGMTNLVEALNHVE